MTSRRLNCYVDETGQDTKGNIFIVSVIVSAESQEEMAEFIKQIEKRSGKSQFKWGRSVLKQRLEFISKIFNQGKAKLTVYYSIYKDTLEFKNSTVLTIAKSINALEDYKEHTFNIYVDGLSKKDENNPMIRLADSVCGFVRDVIEEKTEESERIFDKAVKDKVLVEV